LGNRQRGIRGSIDYLRKIEDWWRSYPYGLRAIFFRTRVMGAIGIWPLSCSCVGLLKAARLKESEITGRQMRVFKDAPARYWYVSGIVLRPELIGGRAIRILLSHGVGSWISSANIKFPSELLALCQPGWAWLAGGSYQAIRAHWLELSKTKRRPPGLGSEVPLGFTLATIKDGGDAQMIHLTQACSVFHLCFLERNVVVLTPFRGGRKSHLCCLRNQLRRFTLTFRFLFQKEAVEKEA
jgi:hypothetical protein